MLVERSRRVVGRALSPQRVDQPVDRDDLPRVEEQDREQAALLHAAEREQPLTLAHFERPEEPEFKAAGGQSPKLPALSGAWKPLSGPWKRLPRCSPQTPRPGSDAADHVPEEEAPS